MSSGLPEELEPVFRELARCIVGLGPYQQDVVLCGGLVPVIYRRVLPDARSRLRPLTTFDLDWTLPAQLNRRGEGLHERMLRSGFTVRRSGAGKLPVIRYVPEQGAGPSPIYVEFLAPRSGSKRDRKGANRGVVEVQPGLFAQTDPYLGLWLAETLDVDAALVRELGLAGEHRLRLPHPICFILQKALIRDQRERGKQDNDACHLYDVAMLTHGMWPQLRAVMERLTAQGRFPARWFRDVGVSLSEMFASPTSDCCIAVARNYPGLVTEAEISRGMTAFLKACW